MGDTESSPVRLSFNSQLRVEFRGATVTSDAGLLLPRELDEHLGLTALIERHLSDPRTGRNYQFPLPDLFRQSIYLAYTSAICCDDSSFPSPSGAGP
jgi:Transposase DDE domain group 1